MSSRSEVYVSPAGSVELEAIRLDGSPAPTGGAAPIELLARLPSEECGCPEELWRVEGLIVLIHMEEAEGKGEIFVFGGDWESEDVVNARDLPSLRAEMFARLAAIGSE